MKKKPISIKANIGDDKKAYISTMDGEVITIKEEVKEAILTADRKNVIVLLEDGTLYYTNKDLTNKKIIESGVNEFSDVRNDGFIYTDEKGKKYRVLLSDGSKSELGKDVDIVVANDNITVLYNDVDGNINILNYNSIEARTIGNTKNKIELIAVTNDGSMSIWTIKEDNKLTIILNEKDEKYTLETFKTNYEYGHIEVYFSKNQQLCTIYSPETKCLWIKEKGKEIVPVKLGNEKKDFTNIYTSKGILSEQNILDDDRLYIILNSDFDYNLYSISLFGDKERVLSKIKECQIANGYVTYVDSDGNLFYAKLIKDMVDKEEKIGSDVWPWGLDISCDGKYIYYMRDYDNELATLYAYKIGDAKSKQVSTEVASFFYEGFGYSYNKYSIDGSTVYYFKDFEETPFSHNYIYNYKGTLMKWSYSSKESEKIASEVIGFSLESGLMNGINPKGFAFRKFDFVDKNEIEFEDLMYYDGKEVKKLATNIQ